MKHADKNRRHTSNPRVPASGGGRGLMCRVALMLAVTAGAGLVLLWYLCAGPWFFKAADGIAGAGLLAVCVVIALCIVLSARYVVLGGGREL